MVLEFLLYSALFFRVMTVVLAVFLESNKDTETPNLLFYVRSQSLLAVLKQASFGLCDFSMEVCKDMKYLSTTIISMSGIAKEQIGPF